MGGLEDWIRANHLRVGKYAALATSWVPFAAAYWGFKNKPLSEEQCDLLAVATISPGLAWVAVQIATVAALSYLAQDNQKKRRAREIREAVFAREPPKMDLGKEGYSQGLSLDDAIFRWLNMWRLDGDVTLAKASESKNAYLAHMAAGEYFIRNRFDDALGAMRTALDWSGGKQNKISLAMRPIWAMYEGMTNIGLAMYPGRVKMLLELAMYHSLSNPEKAWAWSEVARRVGTELDKEYEREAYVFHALLASAQRRSDERDAWRDAVVKLMESGEVEAVSARESRSRVFRFAGDFFANTMVVKQRPDLESLSKEYEWTYRARACSSSFDVPEPLFVSDEADGLSALVLRYRKGEVVYDMLERNDKSAVPQVADALGVFGARLDGSYLPRQDLRKKAELKLASKKLGIPGDLAAHILGNYDLIFDACERVPWVVDMDKHQEQWVYGEGRLTALDWEVKERVPFTFDDANFLAYRKRFNADEQREFVGRHVKSFEGSGGAVDLGAVLPAFHASVAYRSLCLAEAWSGRESMRGYRREVLLQGAESFDFLERTSFCRGREEKARMLKECYFKMADLMIP